MTDDSDPKAGQAGRWWRRASYTGWVFGFANLAQGTSSHEIVGGAFLVGGAACAWQARRAQKGEESPPAESTLAASAPREDPPVTITNRPDEPT